jgi:hypothetical protein
VNAIDVFSTPERDMCRCLLVDYADTCNSPPMMECLPIRVADPMSTPSLRTTFWRWVAHPASQLLSKHHLRPL